MKTTYIKPIMYAAVFFSILSCKKNEKSDYGYPEQTSSKDFTEMISDSISSVATLQMKDREFIKTAQVDMEVKEVYAATLNIEKLAKELGGFVTQSELRNDIVSEDTYSISDKDAMLVKKYQPVNTIKIKVPTIKLGEFLEAINKNNVFLNARIINAEDVTANIKLAELENKRIKENNSDISTLKNNKDKVNLKNENRTENNQQQYASMNISDQLKYSAVDIFIKESGLRVSEIPVTNSKNADNKFKYNFFYDVKNAVVEGFYLTQSIIIGLIQIWPVLIILGFLFFFIRRKKLLKHNQSNTSN